MKHSYYAIKNIFTDNIVKDKTDMPRLFTESEEDIVNMLVNHYNSMGSYHKTTRCCNPSRTVNAGEIARI